MDFLRLLSKKRLQRLSGASSTDSGSLSSDSSTVGSVLRSATRHSALPPFEQELHDVVSGRLGPTASGPDSAAFSSASYAARDPCRDVRILHADCFSLLAAVLTFGPEAQPNGRYLQRNLQHEVLEQAAGTGDAAAAVPAAIAALNSAYRNLHPFNGPVLEGVLVAVAYVDLREQTLHLCSNHGCRVVAGRAAPVGEVVVAAELGRGAARDPNPNPAKQQAARARDASAGAEQQAARAQDALAAAGGSAPLAVASVALSEAVDTVIVASEGVWRELPAYKALLRLQHWVAAGAAVALRPAGGAAGHLVNAALHAVAARAGRLADPRMRSLRSVSHLASLWAGDRSSYKYRGRQVVRRRRGDVHGDLTVVVLQLGAAAAATATPAAALPAAAAGVLPAAIGRAAAGRPLKGEAARARAAARWALLRMHFVTYRRAARAHTYAQWHQAVAGAVALKGAAGQRAAAAADTALRTRATDAVANLARPLAALPQVHPEKTRPVGHANTAKQAAAGRAGRADQENASEQRLAAAARQPRPPPIVRQNASRNLLAPSRGHGPRLAASGLGRAGSAPAQIPLHMLGLGSVLQAH